MASGWKLLSGTGSYYRDFMKSSHYRNRFGVVSFSQNSAEKTQRVIPGGVAVPFCFRFALRATLQQNGTLSSPKRTSAFLWKSPVPTAS